MKFAHVVNDIIHDIAPGVPALLYHPDVAKLFTTKVPDNANKGDTFKDGVLTKAVPIEAPVINLPVMVTPPHFKNLFTLTEQVKIKKLRATDELLDAFFTNLEDPRLQALDLNSNTTKEVIAALQSTDPAVLTAERAQAVLSNTAP